MAKEFDRQRGENKDLHSAAEKRKAPSAKTVFESIRHEGEEELARHWLQLVWSGLAAGLAMGFSLLTEGLLAHSLPDAEWAHVVSALGYSVGFIIVVLGRQQLYTETPVTAVLPVLSDKSWRYLRSMLRLWGIVLISNLVGTLIFSFVLAHTDLFSYAEHKKFEEISRGMFQFEFWTSLLGGIFAGWLIALMVWLLPFAETARIFVILLTTYIIGLAGFPHIIAGATEAFYAVIRGLAGWGEFFLRFFIPALIGNTLGGLLLVALLNYGQVAPGGGTGNTLE